MPILLEGEGRIPTWEDIDSQFGELQYKIHIEGPKTLAIIIQRCNEEREARRKLIVESNLLHLGQKDVLGDLHKSSGSKFGNGPFFKMIAAEVNHQNPRKNGWGPRRNMTRVEFGNYTNDVLRKKKIEDGIDKINLAFSEAERSMGR